MLNLITIASSLIVLLSSFLFGWTVLIGYKKMPIHQFVYLIILSILTSVFGFSQIAVQLTTNQLWIMVFYRLSSTAMLLALIMIILYIESLWRPKINKMVLTSAILALFIDSLILLLLPVEIFRFENAVIVRIKNTSILPYIPAIIIFSLILYETYKAFLLIRKLSPGLRRFVGFLFLLSMTSVMVIIFYCTPTIDKVLYMVSLYGNALLASIFLLSGSIYVLRDPVKNLMSVNIYVAVFTTSIGLKIAERAFVDEYESRLGIIASLVATMLSLNIGLSERRYKRVYLEYKIGEEKVIIYIGEKAVLSVLTDTDSKILRELIAAFTRIFESRVKEIPESLIYEDIEKEAEEVINRIQKMIK